MNDDDLPLIGRPDWFAKWTKEPERDPIATHTEAFKWILTRPREVQALLVAFPPSCVVRVKATGAFAVCIGTATGQDDQGRDAEPEIVTVPEPGAKAKSYWRPRELEVVGFWNGLTREAVAAMIAVAKIQAVEPRPARVPRNNPCPCGSGKKYKHCCLGKPAETAREGLN